MLSRRGFLRLAGLGGAGLWGVPLGGCGSKPVDEPGGGAGVESLPDDPSKPWWLRKDFAPVSESETTSLEIVGTLPPALTGVYLRNGPNPLKSDSKHWFVGDGMVHGTRLEKGKAVWYRARYVKTAALAGEQSGMEHLGPPTLTDHQANTSILVHDKRVLCLEEVGLPYEISPADLSTIGAYDFAGKLATAMTAHPKVDPATGELFFFGYGILDASVTYHRTDASGALVQTEKVPLKKAVMMHDFQVTKSHVVFMDMPIVFDIGLAIAGDGFPFKWAPENGARLGVMPRTGTAGDVKWLDIDPCFVFHTWNAFHDAANDAIIHVDGIRYASIWEKNASDFNANGRPHRFSIDTAAAKVSLAQLDDHMLEFPRINRAHQGGAYRYGYGLSGDKLAGADGSVPPFDRIVKLDRQTGVRQVHQLAAGQEADEALFVPDPSAKTEDGGWLLAYVFDHADNRSHLRVIDASNLAAPPVARVRLPQRVPHGFHGEFAAG